eukprot:TRINITY_DN29806_c0_g1_i1.p1 TRINITY_DN29806_c0_g1~~TRINITY_DN29806_c0_g1_i1.p1  ORF type:complete len:106 (+),score=29.38 TRINITY_DN29806_c0_g1_i1:1-318(+)
MVRRPPRSTLSSSSAASDVYKRQGFGSFQPSLHRGGAAPGLVHAQWAANEVQAPEESEESYAETLVRIREHGVSEGLQEKEAEHCLLYTSPSPRDRTRSRMPSSA